MESLDAVWSATKVVYGGAVSVASRITADPALSISVTAAAITFWTVMKMGAPVSNKGGIADVEIRRTGGVVRRRCDRLDTSAGKVKFTVGNLNGLVRRILLPGWASSSKHTEREISGEVQRSIHRQMAIADDVLDKSEQDPIHWAIIAQMVRVSRMAGRLAVVCPPIPRMGTALISKVFGGDFDELHGIPVRVIDLASSNISLDVRVWASQIEKDPAGLPWRFLVQGIIAIIGAVASAILGDWGNISPNPSIAAANLPPVDDEVAILSAFNSVLEQTTRLVPDKGIVIFEGCEALMRLARTEVGYKAIGLFVSNIVGLARKRGVSIILVSSPAFLHHLLLPLAAKEVAAILPFSDLSRDHARAYFLEQLRVNFGYYTPFSFDDTASPEEKWAMDQNPIVELAAELFEEFVFPVVGGRASDLNAIASIIALVEIIDPSTSSVNVINRSSDEPVIRPLSPAETKKVIHDRINSFPDIFASVRWLEEKLNHPCYETHTTEPEHPTTTNNYPTDISLSTFDPNPSPHWTPYQFVALFDALADSPNGFISYSEALDAIRKATEGSSDISRNDQSGPRVVLRSLIAHGVVAYRPQGLFYFDDTGSRIKDGIAPIRPLHLYVYKQFVRPSLKNTQC
ncbi:hypothetical protein HDU67_008005 [Dinochytrium kinnereticum]|nr:hypothetical protein HDU67_008005 [Dinochytrium kinnereticum]